MPEIYEDETPVSWLAKLDTTRGEYNWLADKAREHGTTVFGVVAKLIEHAAAHDYYPMD